MVILPRAMEQKARAVDLKARQLVLLSRSLHQKGDTLYLEAQLMHLFHLLMKQKRGPANLFLKLLIVLSGQLNGLSGAMAPKARQPELLPRRLHL